jgi:hypothetical protein
VNLRHRWDKIWWYGRESYEPPSLWEEEQGERTDLIAKLVSWSGIWFLVGYAIGRWTC